MVGNVMAICAAVVVWVATVSAAAAQSDQPPNGDAARGQSLFLADGCWECHGTVGQGGGFAGPRISRTELPWPAFLTQLRTPYNNMPPFTQKVLATSDAADIYAFLKSLPKPPNVQSIAILH